VLFDMRDWISNTVSDSLEILKTTVTLLFTTVISFEVSGTAEVNVHSSSSFAVLVEFCTRFDGGGGDPTPSRSTVPVDCGLTDCWNWNGEAWRDVGDVSAAKGSGVERAAWRGRGKFEVGGFIWEGRPGLLMPPKRSTLDWGAGGCCT
jgi:hypothetical protein